jgi:dihydrolipoamide dehydrogenase
MPETYDLVVIGAGPGGFTAAEHAARWGAKVAIIEKNGWGGTCTHRGCIPTKAILACSKSYADMKKLKRFGIESGYFSFNFSAIKHHQQQMVKISALGVQKTLNDAGVHMKSGKAKIISPQDVQCALTDGSISHLKTKNIIIAWGSVPLVLPGIQPSKRILTSDGLLELQTLPESIVIVGGSVIGIEFATFLAELGTKVQLLELAAQLLPYEDGEAADLLKQELSKLRVVIHTSTKVESLRENADGVCVRASHSDKMLEWKADYALICTGRKPYLISDELDRLGIRYDPEGITVDENHKTNIDGIYAIGDVTGGLMLAHRAAQQGKVIASHLFGDRSIRYNQAGIPSVVYSHPSLARVGLTEKQAIKQGLKIEIKKVEYGANIMARTELCGSGFSKTLFHKDQLVGITIVGEDACELISPMALAIACRMGKKDLSNWVIPHPSLSEILSI